MTAEKKEKAKGKTSLPADFSLNDDLRAWAKIHTPYIDAYGTTQEFIDYSRGRDWRMVDWIATWRNWMRKAAKESKGKSRFAGAERPYTPPVLLPNGSVDPQPCRWHASANRILLIVLLDMQGAVSPERLQLLIREKGVMARRLRELNGENDMPPDAWKKVSKQGYEWLLAKARAP